MKLSELQIPEGKRPEWVNGVLTLVDDKPIEYKFKVGDKVKCDDTPELIYTVIGQFAEYGKPMYRLKCTWGETSSAENWLELIPQDITERIKTFEDAVDWCMQNNKVYLVGQLGGVMEKIEYFHDTEDIIAYLKLRIITAALNEGWEPTFAEDERRYYCICDTDGEALRIVSATKIGYITSATLYFKSHELAEYAAKQFGDIYADFCGCKEGGEQ